MNFIQRILNRPPNPDAACAKKTLQYSFDNKRLCFGITSLADDVAAEDWLTMPNLGLSNEDENRRVILGQLVDDGIAVCVANSVEIENNDFWRIIRTEREELLLSPSYYTNGIKIAADSSMNKPNFRYKYQYTDAGGRSIVGMRRVGVFLQYGALKKFLLNEAQYRLLEMMDEQGEDQYSNNLARFATIKGLSAEIGAQLDEYLQRENAVVAEQVSVDIKFIDDDTIELEAVIEGVPQDRLNEIINRRNEPQTIYDLRLGRDNNRLRVVLQERARKGIAAIKECKTLSGENKKDFLRNPAAFIDPEIIAIDLSHYGDRVTGIGVPIPASVENDESNIDWFSGDSEIMLPVEEGSVVKDDVSNDIDKYNELPNATDEQEKNILLVVQNVETLEYTNPENMRDITLQERAELPSNLTKDVRLLKHQLEGLAWLQSIYKENVAGGLLADDMGLGKTLQILAFIMWQRQMENIRTPSLIIAPVVLLDNWQDEYCKFFTTDIKIINLHGQNLARFRTRTTAAPEYRGIPRISLDIEGIKEYDLVLTTYEAVRDYQFSLAKIDWNIVVTDESQKIKNPNSYMTMASKALKAKFKIACTATPVENKLTDLWCIMDFAAQGKLGALTDYHQCYVKALVRGEERSIVAQNLRTTMEPCFKRRLKKDILHDLPEKHIHVETVPMSLVQEREYFAVLRSYQEYTGNKQSKALELLRHLANISACPRMEDYVGDLINIEQVLKESTKINRLLQTLRDIRTQEEKVIIFTDVRKLQRILARMVNEKFGFLPDIVNGEVVGSGGGNTRRKMVERFKHKQGFNVIIMSPLAAGYGLNIVEANHVVHFTRLWNPAKEEQATDRVYRIGQKKPVHVYYFISTASNENTIVFDQNLNTLLARKRKLASDFLFPNEKTNIHGDELNGVLSAEVGENKIISATEVEGLRREKLVALAAALYRKKGYSVDFASSDVSYGVDLICRSDNQSKGRLVFICENDSDVVTEAGEYRLICNYYKEKYGQDFSAVVIVNGACSMEVQDVRIINREELIWMLDEYKIEWYTVYQEIHFKDRR